MTRTTVGWAALLWVVALGCGDSGGDGGAGTSGGEPCVTGVVFDCIGANGCPGKRTCSGGFLTSCVCSSVPPMSVDAATSSDAASMMFDDAGDAPSDGGADAAMLVDASEATDAGDAAMGSCDQCVASAPSGWDGPVWVYQGAAAAPACGGEYPDVVAAGGTSLSAGAASCSTCMCTGTGTCPMGAVFESGGADNTCGGGCSNTVTSPCATLTPSCIVGQATTWVETHPPAGSVTGCSASPQTPNVPATSWDENARACGPATALVRGACDTGEVCAPEGPFAGALCIYETGDVSCPGSGYTDKRVYYTGIDDTRDCTACGCGLDCAYTWNFYDFGDTGCASPTATITAPNQCIAMTPSSDTIRVGVSSDTPPGPCTASGGAPTGSATETNPVTFCCVP